MSNDTTRDSAHPRVAGNVSWLHVAGGTALIAIGLSRRSWPGAVVALAGADLVGFGLTGRSRMLAPVRGRRTVVDAKATLVIHRPATVVADHLRDATVVARVLPGAAAARATGPGRLEWSARAPAGIEIGGRWRLREADGEQTLAWEPEDGSRAPVRLELRLADAPGGRGTMVTARLRAVSPGGGVAAGIGRLLGAPARIALAASLRRLKQLIEAGEVASTSGQPVGPGDRWSPASVL
jgi:uncharacterized membrane protein